MSQDIDRAIETATKTLHDLLPRVKRDHDTGVFIIKDDITNDWRPMGDHELKAMRDKQALIEEEIIPVKQVEAKRLADKIVKDATDVLDMKRRNHTIATILMNAKQQAAEHVAWNAHGDAYAIVENAEYKAKQHAEQAAMNGDICAKQNLGDLPKPPFTLKKIEEDLKIEQEVIHDAYCRKTDAHHAAVDHYFEVIFKLTEENARMRMRDITDKILINLHHAQMHLSVAHSILLRVHRGHGNHQRHQQLVDVAANIANFNAKDYLCFRINDGDKEI